MKLNIFPSLAINILLSKLPESAIAVINSEATKLAPYNSFSNIFLIYDKGVLAYTISLARLYQDEEISRTPEIENRLIDWQILQTYRIINAAISSLHPSLVSYKTQLIAFKIELEQTESLSTLFNDLYSDPTNLPDIIATGHGVGIKDTELNFPNDKSSVVFYSRFGGRITNSLGRTIDNGTYENSSVVIKDERKQVYYMPGNQLQPKIYSQKSKKSLNDFQLVTRTEGNNRLKAKIIETITGKILDETDSSMLLSDVLKKFPDRRRVHWAACTRIKRDNEEKNFGRYADYLWTYLRQPIEHGDNNHRKEKRKAENEPKYNELPLFFTKPPKRPKIEDNSSTDALSLNTYGTFIVSQSKYLFLSKK